MSMEFIEFFSNSCWTNNKLKIFPYSANFKMFYIFSDFSKNFTIYLLTSLLNNEVTLLLIMIN